MKKLQISGKESNSRIYTGVRTDEILSLLPKGRIIVISDENVAALYGDMFSTFEQILIGQGEGQKDLEAVLGIYDELLARKADRKTFILAVGGGIVCDVAGFAAATYLRGLPFGFVSTTLLSQVDASVGGKNGVNFQGFKNMVGTFRQPAFVLCPPDMLKTLPEKELTNGFAEIIKHTLIGDAEMFRWLEQHHGEVAALQREAVNHVVDHAVNFKAAVVNRDEQEHGMRRLLNLGHTLGHAIEKQGGFTHGEAVAVGVCIAAEISAGMGLLSPDEVSRIRNLLTSIGLPVSHPYPQDVLLQAFWQDKKREAESLHYVLLDGIGNAFVRPMPILELAERYVRVHEKVFQSPG